MQRLRVLDDHVSAEKRLQTSHQCSCAAAASSGSVTFSNEWLPIDIRYSGMEKLGARVHMCIYAA